MKIKAIALLTCSLSCLLLASCGKETAKVKSSLAPASSVAEENSSALLNESGIFLNSVLDLKLLDHNTEEVRSAVFQYLAEFEQKLSLKVKNSKINEINANAGISPVEADDEILDIIEKAIHYAKLSEGSFDITIAPVSTLWGIDTKDEKIPSPEELSKALSKVDYKKIELNKSKKTVFLKEKGMSIDLGGIAKGYAADKIKEILIKHKVKSAIINLGGNIIVHGKKGEKPFSLGLQKPFGALNEYIAVLRVSDKTVVTSGDYERYFTENGKIYHHILSPATGYPIENELDATVIIATSSVDSDALSTTVFALGMEKGQELIDSLPDVDVIFITKDKKLHTNEKIKKMLEIVDENYSFLE